MRSPGRGRGWGPTRGAPPPGDRGGFVLGLVVLFLFAIAVAATAGYQMVSTEFSLAQSSRDGQKALVVARGGLERFLGEQIGVVGDSVSYAIGDGIATITTRKILEKDSLNHLYYVRSEGTVSDLRTPADPARRVVGTYAWHRIAPIPHKAAVVVTGGHLVVDDIGLGQNGPHAFIDGYDIAGGACAGGGPTGVAGVATAGSTGNAGGTLQGTPAVDASYPGFQSVYDTVGIRWDILSDPNFPVEFESTFPDFSALPADSFPLVRFQGDWTGHFWDGRGVLVVTGAFRPGWGFTWKGIVLAGELLPYTWWYNPDVEGMLVAGLNGSQPSLTLESGRYRYDSCDVYRADRSLSFLERVDHAVFEAN